MKKHLIWGAFLVVSQQKKSTLYRCFSCFEHCSYLFLSNLQLSFKNFQVFFGFIDLLLVLGTHQF